jgi:hypothetical protein
MESLPPVSTEAPRTWDRPLVMLPLFTLIAAVGGLFGSFTVSANLLVLGVGGALSWLGLTGLTRRSQDARRAGDAWRAGDGVRVGDAAQVGRRPAPRRLPPGAVWWLVPVSTLALVELFAFTMQSIGDFPTLSLLADPILAGYLPRAVCYFAWLAGFWGLIRR